MFNVEKWSDEDTLRANANALAMERALGDREQDTLLSDIANSKIFKAFVHFSGYVVAGVRVTYKMTKFVVSSVNVKLSAYLAGGTTGAGYGGISYKSG